MKQQEKVVPIHDSITPLMGENDPAIVERIAELLDEAKKGEIISIAWIKIRPGGAVQANWEVRSPYRFAAVGAVACLLHDMTKTAE